MTRTASSVPRHAANSLIKVVPSVPASCEALLMGASPAAVPRQVTYREPFLCATVHVQLRRCNEERERDGLWRDDLALLQARGGKMLGFDTGGQAV